MQDGDRFREGVRTHLRALGQTQRELARAIGLHPQVLSHKLHGRPALTTREVLAIIRTLAEWGALTTRSEVRALRESMCVPAQAIPPEVWEATPFSSLEQDEPTPQTSSAPLLPGRPGGPPQLRPAPLPTPITPFIGRRVERAAVHQALAASRLVTLTGVGGTGKTRLALEVAREVAVTFPDGVAFADLGHIPDPVLVAGSLTQALGLAEHAAVPPEEQLLRALQPASLLLVIDNLEHLLDAVPLLGRLISAAPCLRLLVTSRISLRLYGEQEIRVPPLRLPDEDNKRDSEAVQLFVQRAQAVRPGFDPQGQTLEAVAAICVALDGLPLAIELAAARVKLFPPEALLPLLRKRLALLIGGPRDLPHRQQTLRAALDWSYALLPAEDQALFARLGIFAGPFDAAAAACADVDGGENPAALLERLAELANQSLLEVTPAPTPRFCLLETVREYALARLAETGDADRISVAHARYFLRLAEQDEQSFQGPEQGRWIARLEAEQDNLRAALRWFLDTGDLEHAGRLLRQLGRLWSMRGQLVEARRWAEELLAREAPPSARAQACLLAGLAAMLQGDEAAAALLDEAEALGRAEGDRYVEGFSLLFTGTFAPARGDLAGGIARLRQGQVVLHEAGEQWGAGFCLAALSSQSLLLEHVDEAERYAVEYVTLAQQTGNLHSLAGALDCLALVALVRQDLDRAGTLLREALVLALEAGHEPFIAYALMGLAVVAARDDPVGAARHFGAADALLAAIGGAHHPVRRRLYDPTRETVRAALGAEAFQVAWDEGRQISPEQVIAEDTRRNT